MPLLIFLAPYCAEGTNMNKIIDINNLEALIYTNGDMIIGHTPSGKETTVIDELAEVGKMIDKIQILICKDYYSSAYQKIRRNFTEDELNQEIKRLINAAGRKLLFINSCAKKQGFGFITQLVDKSNLKDLYELSNAYQYAICVWDD